jgi:hypothetical protein
VVKGAIEGYEIQEPIITAQELARMNTSIQPKPTILIELLHKGGERKIVQVTGHDKTHSLLIAWPMSGVFRLDLKLNQLIPKSKKGFGARMWGAADLERCWQVWNDLNGNIGLKRK